MKGISVLKLTEDIDESAGLAGSQLVLHGAAVGADDARVGRGHVQAEELAVVFLLVDVLLLSDLDVVNVPAGVVRMVRWGKVMMEASAEKGKRSGGVSAIMSDQIV